MAMCTECQGASSILYSLAGMCQCVGVVPKSSRRRFVLLQKEDYDSVLVEVQSVLWDILLAIHQRLHCSFLTRRALPRELSGNIVDRLFWVHCMLTRGALPRELSCNIFDRPLV